MPMTTLSVDNAGSALQTMQGQINAFAVEHGVAAVGEGRVWDNTGRHWVWFKGKVGDWLDFM